MSGRILIVDSIATNRILLRAMLQAAHYDVTPCASIAEATGQIALQRPDMVILDVCQEPDAALALCARMRAEADLSSIPLIATLSGDYNHRHAPSRIAALRAGADDVIDKSAPDAFLQARIRSLLRARHAAAELSLREDMDPTAGFAEVADTFTGPGTVAVIVPGR
jgi:two-component system, cell cycle response regulator